MSAAPNARFRVELVLVPLVAAVCMAFIIGAIVLDKGAGSCPQPNWHNHLTLSLSGSPSAVSSVSAITACAGSNCVPMNPTFAKLATGAPSLLARQGDGSWVLNVDTEPPTAVTFRAYDAAGNLLIQQSDTFNWTRVGGTEQCGGPMGAMTVPLRLPG
jgi:hypothetical protein